MGLNSRNILLAGATGMVGGLTLNRLLEDRNFKGAVLAPSRRALAISDDRLTVLQTEFISASADSEIVAAVGEHPARRLDAYVCCLGTTIRTAGSREAFIAVDRDLVLGLAQTAFRQGARHAILVSSTGASRQSGNFYLRLKGEVEDAMENMGFDRLDIVRPGLLLGERTQRRPGEALMRALAPLVNPVMLGKLRRYRAIDADAVARAMVRLLVFDAPGRFVHDNDSIQMLAG